MKLIVFSLFLWATLVVSVSSDLASDRAALLALRAAVGGRIRLWNLSSSPCSWTGVNCVQNRVVELRLPGMGLSGQLPIAIGNLTQLQTLSLRFNALSGSIPSDFAKLTTLRNLYLQGNGFSGQIPGFLFTLQNLIIFRERAEGIRSGGSIEGNKGAGRTPLNWDTRSSIALGAAKGIAYLHSKGPGISHGNIKSSNILLTTSYEARVSDFGLAQLSGPTSTPNRVDGYRAPEVTDARKVSQKADVYSFGVLLLELLTGKAPTHALTNEEGVDLPRWVQSVVREEWTAEVFDLELLRYQNVEEDMVQLLQLAINCTAQYPDKRPAMDEVTSQIEELCRSSDQRT
ncbi:hypothetical protein GOBAR_DD14211 [Gossypium barbadense]|nr:hypothetical protein GOBAR_DD14211 [Gossypium barbadense]